MKKVGKKKQNQDFFFTYVTLIISELWPLEDIWLEKASSHLDVEVLRKGFGWGYEFRSHLYKDSI